MNQAEVLIIGVIYNTYPETLRYLDSLTPFATDNIAVILADNSDMEKPPEFLEKIKDYPFLSYIETGQNLGYFGGAREGLIYYLRQYSIYPQWIIVTNVDIVFTPQFLNRLYELNDRPNIGIVAPSIISKKWNVDYNPEISVRYSKWRFYIYRLLYSSYLIHNLYLLAAYIKKFMLGLRRRKLEGLEYQPQNVRKIYAPHGSCLVINRNYFALGGTLDLPHFLFGEEIFLAETAARLRVDVIYDPGILIYDYEHASTGFFVTPRINNYHRQAIQSILIQYYR